MEDVKAGFDPELLGLVPQTLQKVVDEGALSGFVTMVWHRGELVQLNTIGLRNVAAGAPMERDTLFRIASMTKPIVSVATLMLMEEGKLRLDDPIGKWLPEFAEMRVLNDPAGPLDETHPAPREITVDDLLTHRAGLAYAFSAQGPLAQAYDKSVGSAFVSGLTPDQWLAELGALPLAYPPGQRMHYSHASDVLGFLIARVAGEPLGQLLKRRIFDPLGMNDTSFWVAPEQRDRMAHIYRKPAAGGPLIDFSIPMEDSPAAFEGGGAGLVSTVDDYLAFARMMLGRGKLGGVRLLKPETVDLMTRNHLTPSQMEYLFIGLPYWDTRGFGLGVSLVMEPDKYAETGNAGAKNAFGWPGAFGTWWQADPENDLILLYMIQDSVDLSATTVTGARQEAASRLALLAFQQQVYAALR